MKFKFAFKVHSSILITGTRYITEMEGLVKVKAAYGTLGFLFEYEDSPVWKYLPSNALITGWNEISIDGDDEKIRLTVNGHYFTLVDESTAYSVKVASGFSSGSYVFSAFTGNVPSSITSFEYQIGLIIPSELRQNCRICQDRNSYDNAYQPKIEIYNGKCGMATPALNDWASAGHGIPVSLNSSIIVRFSYDGTSYKEEYSIDAGQTFEPNYNEIENMNFTLNSYQQCWGGRSYDNLSSCIFADGQINMLQTHIILNGTTFIDGNTYQFTTSGSSAKVQDETIYPKGKYPELHTKSLNNYQSWLYLKDIEALRIED